jgi:heat shock protein HslJ
MRLPSFLLALLAVCIAAMLFAAGCTSTPPTNATKTPTPAGTGTLVPTVPPTSVATGNATGIPTANMTGNMTLPTVNATGNVTPVSLNASFVNATWRWVARAGSESITVSSPDKYTIAFNTNGTYALKADCNTGSGNFTVNGTKVKISPGTLTKAYCGDNSLDRSLIAALDQVTAFEMDAQGRLVLLMVNSNERLVFQKVV